MHNQIIQFLEDKKIIYYKQFGFHKNVSTAHVILTLIENVQSALDNNKFACGIFIVLENFYTVNHNILLSKPNFYGIRGIKNDWFNSYLSNWSQFVLINGFNSDHWSIECRVSQEPLFFLIFINNLNFTIRKSSISHFADDTCLLNIKSKIQEIDKYVNQDPRFVSKCLNANKISLDF